MGHGVAVAQAGVGEANARQGAGIEKGSAGGPVAGDRRAQVGGDHFHGVQVHGLGERLGQPGSVALHGVGQGVHGGGGHQGSRQVGDEEWVQ